MTDLVSQLFIAMIPIDFKITNFPYTCILFQAKQVKIKESIFFA